MEQRRFSEIKAKQNGDKEEVTNRLPHLFYHAEDTSSSKEFNEFVLSRLNGLRNAKDVTFEVPYRWGSVFAVVGDDVFAVGGNPPSKEVSILNSIRGNVISATLMRENRSNPSAVSSADCLWLLVFGGENERREFLCSCESYSVSMRRWMPMVAMPTRRSSSSALHVPGEGFFVVGGCHGKTALRVVEVLSEEAPVWQRLEPMLEERKQPGVAVFRGRLVVAGGDRKTSVECLSLNSVGPRQWTRLAGFEENRSGGFPLWHSLVSLGEKLILSDDDGFLLEFSATSTSNESQIENFSWKNLFRIDNVTQFRLLAIRRGQ